MPAKLVTLRSIRGKPGLFRCSVCRCEFRGQDVLKQFVAHLRKDHQVADGAKARAKVGAKR